MSFTRLDRGSLAAAAAGGRRGGSKSEAGSLWPPRLNALHKFSNFDWFECVVFF